MQLPENILVLIEKYQLGTITPAEKVLLDKWYQSFNDRKAEVVINEYESEQQIGDRIKERVLQTIRNEDVIISRAPRKWLIPAAAATALLLISTGVYFMLSHNNKQEVPVAKVPLPKAKKEIVPGGNKAMLTLADGSSIILDSTLD